MKNLCGYKAEPVSYAYHKPKTMLRAAAAVWSRACQPDKFFDVRTNGNPINPDISNIPTIEPNPNTARYDNPTQVDLICDNTNRVNAPDPANPCMVPMSSGFTPIEVIACV